MMTILGKCSVSFLFGMNFWKIDRKLYFNHPIYLLLGLVWYCSIMMFKTSIEMFVKIFIILFDVTSVSIRLHPFSRKELVVFARLFFYQP